MKRFSLIFAAVLLTVGLAACSDDKQDSKQEETKPVFKIGAIPDQNASKLDKGMTDMANYLSKETGLKVEFVPSVDYNALVKGFERNEIQLAWFGGLTGVQARSLVEEADAIAQRPFDAEFHSVFITQKGGGIKSLEDLRGNSFTFGSESSTSGHLMARYYMTKAGINPDKDLDGQPNYSGSHDKTYKLIESGAYKAGALNESVWKAAVKNKKVDLNKVEVFYTTPAYFDYHWTINKVDKTYGDGTEEKVKKALLNMNVTEHKDVADLFQTDKFVETNNKNYKAIEEVAKQLRIIK